MSQGNSTDFYQEIIQAQALDKEVKKHLDIIQENDQRIQFLEKQRAERNDSMQEAERELKLAQEESAKCEKELAELEAKIHKSNEHISNATTQQQADAITKELETLTPLAGEKEDRILELIDQIEQLQEQIKGHEEFLKGSEKTLEEIRNEVSNLNKKEKQDIDNLEERIANLLETIPKSFKDIFLESQKEHRFQHPVAFIENRCCSQCRFAVDITIQENVTKALSPERCPSCSRMLLPISSSSVTS